MAAAPVVPVAAAAAADEEEEEDSADGDLDDEEEEENEEEENSIDGKFVVHDDEDDEETEKVKVHIKSTHFSSRREGELRKKISAWNQSDNDPNFDITKNLDELSKEYEEIEDAMHSDYEAEEEDDDDDDDDVSSSSSSSSSSPSLSSSSSEERRKRKRRQKKKQKKGSDDDDASSSSSSSDEKKKKKKKKKLKKSKKSKGSDSELLPDLMDIDDTDAVTPTPAPPPNKARPSIYTFFDKPSPPAAERIPLPPLSPVKTKKTSSAAAPAAPPPPPPDPVDPTPDASSMPPSIVFSPLPSTQNLNPTYSSVSARDIFLLKITEEDRAMIAQPPDNDAALAEAQHRFIHNVIQASIEHATAKSHLTQIRNNLRPVATQAVARSAGDELAEAANEILMASHDLEFEAMFIDDDCELL
jgi:hypothetical protein